MVSREELIIFLVLPVKLVLDNFSQVGYKAIQNLYIFSIPHTPVSQINVGDAKTKTTEKTRNTYIITSILIQHHTLTLVLILYIMKDSVLEITCFSCDTMETYNG